MKRFKIKIDLSSNPDWEAASEACRTLKIAGFAAFIVGGAVRDGLLGKECKDIDIATSASPEKVTELFEKVDLVGASFGVCIVRLHDRHIEVATFREDVSYSDGRRPDAVKFSTAEMDSRRRDFTINAMFYDPLAEEVLDWHNGMEDLNDGLVRAVGDPHERFSEDHLRMLRAVRFASRMGFEIERDTMAAIRHSAECIKKISGERIFMEIDKILVGANPRRGIELLSECELLFRIFPEIECMHGVTQPWEFHPEGDVWAHTMMVIEGLKPDSPSKLAWAALLHDVGKPPTYELDGDIERFRRHAYVGHKIAQDMLQRMKCSNEFVEDVSSMVRTHMKFGDVEKMKKSKVRTILSRPTIDLDIELHRLDCMGKQRHEPTVDFILAKKAEYEAEGPIPEPLVNGHDLMPLGVAQGPMMGMLLREVREKQLEDELMTHDETIEWLKVRIPELSQ